MARRQDPGTIGVRVGLRHRILAVFRYRFVDPHSVSCVSCLRLVVLGVDLRQTCAFLARQRGCNGMSYTMVRALFT